MARKRGREEIGGEDRTDKEQCSMYPWDRDQADSAAMQTLMSGIDRMCKLLREFHSLTECLSTGDETVSKPSTGSQAGLGLSAKPLSK